MIERNFQLAKPCYSFETLRRNLEDLTNILRISLPR